MLHDDLRCRNARWACESAVHRCGGCTLLMRALDDHRFNPAPFKPRSIRLAEATSVSHSEHRELQCSETHGGGGWQVALLPVAKHIDILAANLLVTRWL